ncbi:hypothetical protein C7974DRAFT_153026 [Boeremia exigua]|uniref:uncharacterized protein n=1 Tax=Boeremia exigua TaxID=749465 RepID=UPI001E8D7883|nr:uncharacterized protein C7974DRAFT_153026 [Boeremia exigua]KAH6638038.1 hypothetical protein C7974DRAFT_153026 [Boeremia exigua]
MGWRLFDCADSSVNCSENKTRVLADPDVAGIGIIVGFLSSTCLAFLIAFTVLFLDRFNDIVNFYRRTFTNRKTAYEQNHDDSTKYWRSVAFWSRVLSKNLLAFSDTQLLTGLAIQFTALIKHCSMSVYHFRIVTDLAFLTTVTHLLTVVALRNYFVKNKWINLPRIFFMLGNLGLLGYTSFVSYSYDIVHLDLSDDLACFFKGERPPFKAAFGGKWAALLIGAIGGHVTVIAAMYWLKDPDPNKKGAWWWWIWYLGAIFRTWIVAPAYSIYGIYMAGDGLQYTQALGKPPAGVEIDGDESKWNFGQFLPVLLLALPIFAGWESFWEEKDEDRENRFGRHFHRKSGNTLAAESFVLDMQQKKITQGHSTDPSTEELQIESNGPSPATTPRVAPRASPHLRSNSGDTSTLHPSSGSDMLLSVPLPAASPGLELNFSRPTPPRSPPGSLPRPRGSTT